MDNYLTDFRRHCQEEALEVIWRQWCSLGVAGHARPASARYLVDLEALILATTSIGRYDPRLFDKALDWLSRYGTLVNIQRLKNLGKATDLGDTEVLSALAEWLVTRGKQPRWKAMISRAGAGQEPEPLFHSSFRGQPESPDPVFRKHRLLRPVVAPRGMSQAPEPIGANLMVTFRALIGVSARVEIILCLAGGTIRNSSEIARIIGYAPRTVQGLLQEMALSGQVLASDALEPRPGVSRYYQVKPADWAFLSNGASFPEWFPWAQVFGLVKHVLDAIPETGEKSRHPAVISSSLRNVLQGYAGALSQSEVLRWLEVRGAMKGEDLLRVLSVTLPSLLRRLQGPT
jgi:hypothetical protein